MNARVVVGLFAAIGACACTSNSRACDNGGCEDSFPTAAIRHADGRAFAIGEEYEFILPDGPSTACTDSDCDGGIGPPQTTCAIRSSNFVDCEPNATQGSAYPFVSLHDASTLWLNAGNASVFRLIVKSATGDVLTSTTVHSTIADDGCCGTLVPGEVTIP